MEIFLRRRDVVHNMAFRLSVVFAGYATAIALFALRHGAMLEGKATYVRTLGLAIALAIAASAILILSYLHGDFARRDALRLERRFGDIEARLPKLTKALPTEAGSDVERIAVDASNNNRDSAYVERETRDYYSTDALTDLRVTEVRRMFESTIIGLREEIRNLTARSNLNLTIGTISTGCAITLLAYMVLGAQMSFPNLTVLLTHYLPRLTTVAFIEVFAFFFLQQYRSTLEEMRFYQNEIVNLSVQFIAVSSAYRCASESGRDAVLKQLVSF